MSADNWAVCPKCKNTTAELEKTLESQYGVLSQEEYDRLKIEFQTVRADLDRTFREDYEFYGAETGVLHISYHGECGECGLKLLVDEKKEFYRCSPQ